MKKAILLIICLIMAAGMVFSGPGGDRSAAGALPRNETLYFAGPVSNEVTRWNPYGIGGVAWNITNAVLSQQLTWETLFLFNVLDETTNPHIGETYTWNGYNLRVTIRRDVRFNNGAALTSADVVHSYLIHRDYTTPYSGLWAGNLLVDVVAIDNYTIEIRGNPQNFHPRRIEETLCSLYITNKAEFDRLLTTLDPQRGTPQSNRMAVAQYPMMNPISTAAYKPFFSDITRVVVERRDDWWGIAKYGRLPAPRYIASNFFRDNAAADRALAAGEVDVSSNFINQVWLMWERDRLPIHTFIPVTPYYFPNSTPHLIYNVAVPGLDDPVVRRAITASLDYPLLATNAVSSFSEPAQPHKMLPIPTEMALLDEAALRPYQWSTNRDERIAQANRELDAAGWVRGADGIRARGGVRLAFMAETVSGWSDWQAGLEIAAVNARDVGIQITTQFLTSPIVTQNRNDGTFQIVVNNVNSIGPNNPLGRYHRLMGSDEMTPVGVPNTVQNFGRWINQEVDQIIAELGTATDPARIRQLYTRLNIIYLQEAPITVLWYGFHYYTVNTSVWEGFPVLGDGSNVGPTNFAGYGFNYLFNIRPRGR